MNKILLASHGPLANGMKKTAEFLMGQNENVETLCAYVDEQSKDLPAMVEKWMNERNPEDQWVVITDIFGGSINNEFMIRAQEGGYWLIAGMNLPLVLSLWYETENLTEKQLETNISEASEGIVLCKLLRVDHRLLHGQVAMAWTQSLDSDCILIANDAVVNDNIRKTTMKLAKPNGVKLVMKNIEDSIAALNAGVTDKYKLFIVVESIEDAYRLAKGYAGIRSINLGGCKPKEDIVKTLYKTIPVTARDEEMLKELLNDGIEIEIRQVPGEQKVKVSENM